MSETQTPVDEAFLRDFKDMQRQLQDVRNASVGGATFSPGDLIASAATTRPGCLLCDGTAYSRTDYAALFDAIGTAFGTGDGSTTFNIPDYRGRALVGAGTGTGLTARAIGAAFGVEAVTLTAAESGMPAHTTGAGTAHSHTGTTSGGSAHSHSGTTGAGSAHSHGAATGLGLVQASAGGGGLATGAANFTTGGTNSESAHTHAFTTSSESSHTHTFTSATEAAHTHNVSAVGASSAHTNVQPSLPANIFIKT